MEGGKIKKSPQTFWLEGFDAFDVLAFSGADGTRTRDPMRDRHVF